MSVQSLPGIGAGAGGTPRIARGQHQEEPPNTPASIKPAEVAPVEQSPDKTLTGLIPKNTRLSIEHDKATNRYVFKSVDENTGEVLRQYPTEQMLAQIARVRQIAGLTVDTGA